MNTRKTILTQRKAQPLEQQIFFSSKIIEKAKKLSVFKNSQKIAFYLPVKGEVDCMPLMDEAFAQNKKVFLPSLNNQSLSFSQYNLGNELIQNQYGIKEPPFSVEKMIKTEELGLVFVPLVAFDQGKNRLGMGKGYYDRTFSFLKEKNTTQKQPVLIGLAYELQRVKKLEVNPWDVPLDIVITEKDLLC